MDISKTYQFKIRYRGGIAEENLLPLYDGTESIHGIAQSLQIATHAYLTRKIVTRATALKGAEFYLKPTKTGSFLFDITAIINQYPVGSTIALSVSANVIYDFIKVVLKRATGIINAEPETDHIKKIMDREEPFFDDLSEKLEGSLQRAHRPIGNEIDRITIERPRAELLEFNTDTQDWVETSEESENDEIFTGKITRFNSETRNGRIKIDQLGRIVPFKRTDEFPSGKLGHLTWSLHGSNTELPNLVEVKAFRIKSANGRTKRIVISDCNVFDPEN